MASYPRGGGPPCEISRAFSLLRSCCDGLCARSTVKQARRPKNRGGVSPAEKTYPFGPWKFVSEAFFREESGFGGKGLKKM
jgi:hypothetical protein